MALQKQIPLDGRAVEASPQTRILSAKDRIAKVTAIVSESKVRLEFLKKQYDELKVQAAALGVEDTKQLPAVISRTETELDLALTQLEAALLEAEMITNG